ncbi:phage anti-repressor protein [Filimonas zeae]|uniref:Uncharacterized protein n=1 Tax=Filimonas zeae TaxID=1737353 RepID=A0A917MQY9_9BACT|nr:hypothetical protein [Filimonas zeae]MDR6337447.1 phage anti-repressor protein [Filimonas zeae]GGH58671.1 hypothetical protein GCM10011379_04610 [Filimonas zeae]
MQFNQQIFTVAGQDKATLLATEDAFRLSARSFYNVVDFEQGWQELFKKEDFRNQIDYNSLVSVTRALDGNLLFVRYRGPLNIINCCTFIFPDEEDYARFYHFLEEGLGMQKTEKEVSLFEAVGIYMVELVIVLALTLYCYYQAVTLKYANPRTVGAYWLLIQQIGEMGVCLMGGAISAYLIYRVHQLSANRPVQTVFLAKHL